MTFSSSLAENRRPLILDTSVLINLHACTYGERVLTAVANDIVLSDVVVGELARETRRNNGEINFLNGLVAGGKVTVTAMVEEEFELFAALTAGSPSLDDGEATTISIAASRGFRAVIDEQQGRVRAASLMAGEEPGWSLDLLHHPNVVQILGEVEASDAIYLALRHGRMRIPTRCCDYVVGLIGRQRALECTCLPNFKSLSAGGGTLRLLTQECAFSPPGRRQK